MSWMNNRQWWERSHCQRRWSWGVGDTSEERRSASNSSIEFPIWWRAQSVLWGTTASVRGRGKLSGGERRRQWERGEKRDRLEPPHRERGTKRVRWVWIYVFFLFLIQFNRHDVILNGRNMHRFGKKKYNKCPIYFPSFIIIILQAGNAWRYYLMIT